MHIFDIINKNKLYKGGIGMKKVLIVVDMQNDFINGVLGTAEAEAILPAVVDKIMKYRALGAEGRILATKDTHFDNYPETREGRKLPAVHCIRGTVGWEFNPAVGQALGGEAEVYEKPTFGSEHLAEDLKRTYQGCQDEVEIELIGVCTDICVVSNALLIKAVLPEAEISVDASCCAGVTPESHEAALQTMQMCQITVKR